MSFPENFICPITHSIMKDPVICEDGITYERTAIMQWLQTNSTSPITRQHITSNFIPNIALRNTILDYEKPTLQDLDTKKINTIFTSEQSSYIYNGDYYSSLTLKFNNTLNLENTNLLINTTNIIKKNNIIIAIVDTSSSMNESADIPGIESSGLSRLDLVKHTLNTLVYSLTENDRIFIIQFNNTAKTVSQFVKLDSNGKNEVIEHIKNLYAEGMTNLWAGIKLGIDKIAKDNNYIKDYNISMIIMTDGVSNYNPPRGIIQTLEEHINKKNLNFSINTFGYGYNIDSDLLNEIALLGNGIFGFIPDASMVGTIFVNMISSIITGCVNNLQVNNIDNYEMCTPSNFGLVSINQPVHIIFKGKTPLKTNIKIKINDDENNIMFNTDIKEITESDFCQLMRIELVNILKKTLKTKEKTDLITFQTLLISENKKFNSSYINALIDDIAIDDSNKGQLTKAVEKDLWFDQWGRHYLKSIARAHYLERCITFKELSSQYYISNEFKTEQSRIEKIFCDLPSPIPSDNVIYTNYPAVPVPASASTSISKSKCKKNVPVSMNSYYVQDGGCFDGNSMVTMYDSINKNIYYKYVSQIMKGDKIYCPQNNNKFAYVQCVLKLKVNKKILMSNINGMKITPFHPINIKNKWLYPYEQNMPEYYQIDYMYDFILESNHIIKINDIDVITLGHGFIFNDIVFHEYFGDKIIDDLQKHESWNNGYIVLDDYEFIRNNNMQVIKLKYN